MSNSEKTLIELVTLRNLISEADWGGLATQEYEALKDAADTLAKAVYQLVADNKDLRSALRELWTATSQLQESFRNIGDNYLRD